MTALSLTREKIYRTVARQLHGVVPCWLCGEPVLPAEATLEHILPLSEGGSSHIGQPIRKLLGIGQHDRLTDEQIAEAKAFGGAA